MGDVRPRGVFGGSLLSNTHVMKVDNSAARTQEAQTTCGDFRVVF